MEKHKIKDIFWKILEINPATTGVALKATETIIPMVDTILSRRDFIKAAGATAGAIMTSTLISGETNAQNASASIVETDPKTLEKFTNSAKKIGISKDIVSAFSIRVGFSTWDFFVVPPTESVDSNGKTVTSGERLFVKDVVFNPRGGIELTSTRYMELKKNQGELAADGTTVVTTWSMEKPEPRPDKDQNDTKLEKILWYPELTQEQWAIVAKDRELSAFFGFMGFLPPSTTVGIFSNWGIERETIDVYDPATGKTIKKEAFAYAVDLANELPEGPRKGLIRRERIKVNSESNITPEMVSSAQEYFGEGFEITPDGKVIDKVLGKEIPGFTIVPFNEQTMTPPYKKEVTWGWQRTYEFEGKTDFTVVGTEADVTVAEDGSLDMYAWEYKEGEFKRQNIEFAAPNGGTVEIEGFSPQEVQHMIINNSSDNPNYRINSFETARSLGTKIPNKIINREVYFTHKGMLEKRSAINYFINNFIPVVDNSGKWSAVDTTCFFVGASFKDRTKALVVWMDQNDNPVIVAMEGKYLEMPGYFNPYWKNHDIKDPFNP